MKDILVVEDEKNVFRAIKANLGEENYTYRLVDGAKPAFKEIFDKIPDLIILDMQTEHGLGSSFLANSSHFLDEHKIPILVYSGHPEYKKFCAKFPNVVEFITKDLGSLDLLKQRVKEILGE